MGNYTSLLINEIGENNILAMEVYVDNRLIIAEDSLLMEKVLNLLLNRETNTIFLLNKKSAEELITIDSNKDLATLMNSHYKLSILNYLETEGNLTRYVVIVYEDKDLHLVKNIFDKIQRTANSESSMTKLKKTDILEVLTPREMDLLNLLKIGATNREIASRLGLTEGTVRVYLSRIYSKLGVKSRTQAVLLT